MGGTGASRGKEGPGLLCRNVKVSGRRTSLRMEPYIWDSLKEICERERLTLNEICTQIDERRGEANLTASIRVFIVSYYRTAIGNRGFADVVDTAHPHFHDPVKLAEALMRLYYDRGTVRGEGTADEAARLVGAR